MYQQQQHPIDDIIHQHIHGVSKPQYWDKEKMVNVKMKQRKQSRFGYSYKDTGEIVQSI